MAIKFHSGDRVTGLSTDAKPMFVPANSVFYATDTNDTYDFDGSSWTLRAVGLSATDNITVEGKTQSLADWVIMQKTKPSVATNLVATADGTTTVTVSYDLLSTDKISAVKVEYSTDNSSWNTATTSANDTSYQVTGLTLNTAYYFRVYPSNIIGESGVTTTGSTTTTWSIPDQVTGLSATHDSTYITLTWNAVPATNPVATYSIEHSLSSTFASGVTVLDTTSNLTYADEPTKDVRHYYRVRATNSAGNGTYSSIVDDLIIDGSVTVTGSPTLTASGGYNYYEWTGNGTVTVTGYQVEVLVVGAGGGGGSRNSGGGGGGGVVYTSLITAPTGSQNVVVGSGGAGGSGGIGQQGGSSSLFGITAGGGGYGGGNYLAGGAGGNSGGAGGSASDGGGGGGSGGTSGSLSGTYSADYDGGDRYGGGGGAGGAGTNGGANAGSSQGGAGVSPSAWSGFGNSGVFGKGNRGYYGTPSNSQGGTAGVDGSGEGGEGRGWTQTAGAGGRGTVIIRWQS